MSSRDRRVTGIILLTNASEPAELNVTFRSHFAAKKRPSVGGNFNRKQIQTETPETSRLNTVRCFISNMSTECRGLRQPPLTHSAGI